MMKIYVIAVGRLKEKYLAEAETYYLDSIRKYTEIEVLEVDDDDSEKKVGERILSRLPERSEIILLDVSSNSMDHECFRSKIKDTSERNGSLTFIIGGSTGFGNNVYNRVKQRISFSSMTFPHRLARIFLLDQIKRAFLAG
jgi:23S rRNA (pseudouridine1915-N3)-methyltransferase